MTTHIPVEQVKENLDALLAAVARGETVVISRGEVAIAQITPIEQRSSIGKGGVDAQDDVDPDIVAQLNRVYATESSELDPVLKGLQNQMLSKLPKEDW